MTTAKEILENLNGETLYVTTRGTMGDADGMTKIDDDLINDFAGAEVLKLSDGKSGFENERAYEDIVDELDRYLDKDAKNNNYEDYYVIYKDNQYLLAWI